MKQPIMKTTLLFSITSLILFSCSKPLEPKKEVPIIADKSLIIGDPVDNILEGHLVFPIGSSYRPEIYNPIEDNYRSLKFNYNATSMYKSEITTYDVSYDNHATHEYVNDETSTFDISNILFYNQKTKESYTLTNDTVHILSFAIHKEYENPQILYRVVKSDYNQDSTFNSKDGVMLYSSSLDGKNFVQLTPSYQQYLKYFYYEESQTILVKTMIDADSTNSFDAFDETNFVLVDLKEPKLGTELFTDSTKNILKNQLNIK